MSTHMKYELLYIVPTSFTDDDVGTVEGNVKTLLEKNGAREFEAKRLGKFRFAYPIQKNRHGHYILVNFEAEPAAIAKLDHALRISNEVLRHLILRADEAGGAKFDIVQFTEVNVDMKDDRPRRRREDASTDEKSKPVTAASESTETKSDEDAAPKKDAPAMLSDAELNKKLDAALEDDIKQT